MAELRRLLADDRVVGVGETGLDYHYDNSPRDRQRAAFAAHVGLDRRARQSPGGALPRGLRGRGGHPGGEGAPPRVVFTASPATS